MKLYSYYRSSAAYRVRIALNLKGVHYTVVPINLLKGEQSEQTYLAINSQGLVPALEMDDGRILYQSLAILEYLEIAYPNPGLLPADIFDAALVRSWMNLIACDIHPINNLRILNHLASEYKISDLQKTQWIHRWIGDGFGALEKQIAAAPFAFGSQPTFADVCIVPQIYNALRFKLDMTPFPKLMQVYQACNSLGAFVDASPDQQSDSV